eukprot:s573_g23.t1
MPAHYKNQGPSKLRLRHRGLPPNLEFRKLVRDLRDPRASALRRLQSDGRSRRACISETDGDDIPMGFGLGPRTTGARSSFERTYPFATFVPSSARQLTRTVSATARVWAADSHFIPGSAASTGLRFKEAAETSLRGCAMLLAAFRSKTWTRPHPCAFPMVGDA